MNCPYNDCDYEADAESVERHVHFMTLNEDSRHTAANLGDATVAVAAQIVTEAPAVVLPYQADETHVVMEPNLVPVAEPEPTTEF